jgi:hypothetical protein
VGKRKPALRFFPVVHDAQQLHPGEPLSESAFLIGAFLKVLFVVAETMCRFCLLRFRINGPSQAELDPWV